MVTTFWPAIGGRLAGADGQLVGLSRMLGLRAHGGGKLFHECGDFLKVRRLLFGTLRKIIVAAGNFHVSGVDTACGR